MEQRQGEERLSLRILIYTPLADLSMSKPKMKAFPIIMRILKETIFLQREV